MTEITDKANSLSPAIERFILHWGDMGASWGVNRSVAQIHALLLVSDKPLHAEEIANQLGMARSNVSNSLKDLTTWELVRRAPIKGDRRDHFIAEGDVWEMVFRIVEMRKAREIDPAKSVLSHCLDEARDDPKTNDAAVKRLSDIKELMDLLDGWYGQLKDTPKETLLPLIRMGSKAVDLLKPFLKKKAE
ncbi:MarR family transcriptional regulator [Hyphococcus flavus]|uniref:HTH-type transcriptional regulator n=1 Tax=Hyphococcus flavus TaxID=1866326 RepID=A0AAE9ZE03_9PROT|nr:MarR family transcriptional regulator [Hyphococcus flavus]WDI30797.1 MarR family transcriptional regulator [Hyphococcus flavus]